MVGSEVQNYERSAHTDSPRCGDYGKTEVRLQVVYDLERYEDFNTAVVDRGYETLPMF